MDDTQGKPRKTSNKIKAFLVVLLLVVIVGGYWWLREPDIEPKINPNPTELFTIHGEFPFDKGYKLTISMKYESTTPECKGAAYAFGVIPAASRDRLEHIDAEVVRDKTNSNKFTSKIYKDIFLPERCGWKMIYAYYFIVKADSELDKKLQAEPEHTYRTGATVLTDESTGWAELRFGDVNILCKPDKYEGGAMDCKNANQNELHKLDSNHRAKFKKTKTPNLVNVKFVIQE